MIKSLKLIVSLVSVITAMHLQAGGIYHPRIANPVLEPWRWTDFPEYDTIRISCIAKGSDGGMWMGIGNKAVYYDGYKSHAFIPDSSATIQSLIFEKDNCLLAATSTGIFRYKEGKFRKILNFRFTSQRNFITDKKGDNWIGSDFGLIRITGQAIFCVNHEGYFEISDNGSVVNTVSLVAANDYRINSVEEIKFPVYNLYINQMQKVWMAVDLSDKNMATVDLNELPKNSVAWKFMRAPGLMVSDISGICEGQNSVWVTSDNANIMLLQYLPEKDKWKSINLKELGGDNVQHSILKTPDGTVWVGGHSKLYSLNASGWRVYQYPEVVLPLSYIKLFQDKDDRLFLAGENGSLMKLDLSNKNFCTFSGLNFHCNTPDGKYWFTTNTGEVVSCDSLKQQFCKYSVADGLMNMAMTMFYSKKSGLWAAGSHKGKAAVARYISGHWTLYPFPELYLGIAYNGICELRDSAMVFPANGILELGNNSYRGGFVEFNYQHSVWRWVSMDRVPQRIPSMGQTSDGKLWFSGNSLNVYDGNSTQRIDLPAKSSNWVDDIKISATDHIWVAQGGTGLFYMTGNKWTRFTTFNGLASNMVTNILIKSDSAVYIASDKGISFFDGRQLTPQIIHPEINIQRERGYLRSSADGALWINQGTREWYLYDFKNTLEDPAIFKAIMYQKENKPPQTSIFYSNHEISSTGNVIIAYNGVDYWNQTPGGKIQFSHRLNKGEWSPFSNEKSSVFLDLGAGDYTLEVRSRDLDGNIEQQPAQISFSILPPVYQRNWFILTILFFVVIIGFLLVRLYARNRQIHQLDQLKLRLFTDISHELKTPLTLISLPLQKLLNQPWKQAETTDSLELIHNNVQRLTNLVNQVVDFRRLEAGKIQLEISPGDLVIHLQNIYHYYTPLAHEKKIHFRFECNLQECWVKYDADKLEKIVVNLLSNAFKFTPENEKVDMIAYIDQSASQLQLWVNDSGPGIPPEMQQNIFERFYRLRNEKLNRIPGSGIGLSLAKELIKLHRGTIEVNSDGQSGSSFHLVIPLVTSEKVEAMLPEPEESIDPDRLEGAEKASILLVEDEEPMLRFVSGELKNYFNVEGVSSVEKAFEWLKTEMPDLIISDVMLPGMSGVEFCGMLKLGPMTCHLPVILLTARDSEEDIVEGLETGADDYITKPFQMNQLIARCFNLIETRKRLKDRFADQEQLEGNSFAQNTADQEFLDRAIRIVYENLENSTFDVPQFCKQTNTSKTLLYSKLKSLTGQSATEFVRNIRLKEAKKRLINNVKQYTIAEISYQVGFNDPLYFSRCFRKYFGIPPSEIGK